MAAGVWSDGTELRTVRFDGTLKARFLRLRVLSEVNGQPYASAAEVQPLLEARKGEAPTRDDDG